MAVCPGIAALILSHRENGTSGVKELLKRSFDYKRIAAKIWNPPILLLYPGVITPSSGVTRFTGMRLCIPAPEVAFLPTLALFIAFFIGALGEELGWSGYVIDPMQRRWGALRASIVLGGVWAVYHFIALAQVHRSADWIVGWSVGTVAARVIIVWLDNNAGKSVFASVVLNSSKRHACMHAHAAQLSKGCITAIRKSR